ncbi:MAG: hypothetical protein NZM65_10030 [Flavobacteriales bacterium]|nr:hypothetical protein [Flavobacteriales bacterium]MDW8411010.1 hypothetical protein [Flavobacteriales bacterium]
MPPAGRRPVGRPPLRSAGGSRRPAGVGLLRAPRSLRQSLPPGSRPVGKAVPASGRPPQPSRKSARRRRGHAPPALPENVAATIKKRNNK